MYFPESARREFARRFYDKTIAILQKTEEYDAEGGLVKKATATKSTFKGNVQYELGELQVQLGLATNADIAITCDSSTDVSVGDLVSYSDIKYTVITVIPYDSHKMIVGQKWVAA